MRSARWWIWGVAACLGCRAEVSEPELRRPLESMPRGACVLLVASDLANTWERAEAHEALTILKRSLPEELVAPPELVALQERLAAFETRTGTSLRQDLWLNLMRQRLAVGVYPEDGASLGDILFVAELDDGPRFRSALEAVLRESVPDWRVEETRFDELPAWRVRDGERLDVLLVQDGEFLAFSTADALVHGALEIRRGASEASVLREPACATALEALGRQSVAIVSLDAGAAQWNAKGLTWDSDGVHFKRLVPMAEPAASAAGATPPRREEIMRSVPAGMTMVYYAKPAEMQQLRTLFDDFQCGSMHSSSRRAAMHFAAASSPAPVQSAAAPSATPFGLDRLPFALGQDVLPWAGDEMVLVLADLKPTALVPLPNAALVLEAADGEAAVRSLGELEQRLEGFALMGGQGFEAVHYGGKTYRSLASPVLEALAPSYLVDGDLVVIATTRELLQQIIDTRRAGKGNLLRAPTFRPFTRFVPVGASVVVYADQTKLHQALLQVAHLPRLWGDEVDRAVEIMEGLSVVFEHFPASAAYIERTPEGLTLNGWMREAPE